MNIDDLIEQMKADEIEDATSELITPVDYSKIRPFSSQQIYYHIRAKHLQTYTCQCGRTCINKNEADEYFVKMGKLGGTSDN